LHYVVTQPFLFGGVSYSKGDQVVNQAYADVSGNLYFQAFVVSVSDAGPSINNGGPPPNSIGGTDVPVSAGTYKIPPSASTSGVFSANPVRVLDITNTDSTAQGAIVKLFDASDVSQIPTAHCFYSAQLGSSQIVTKQYLTTLGLVWQIVQGDGGATSLNATGGVDISYAAS
jgi:hypothetical protein